MAINSKLFGALVFCALFFAVFSFAFAETTSVLRPIADGGDDSFNWKDSTRTSCSGTECYIEVDESSGASCTNSDGDGSYIKTDTVDASQTFNLDVSGITDDSTITNIAITTCYSEGDTTLGTFQTRYCNGGVCSDSGVNLMGGAIYNEATQNHTVDFTKTAGSDIEIGVTQTRTGKNIYISQLSAVITYTPPVTPPNGGGTIGSAAGGSRPTQVFFSGTAYPSSTVKIFRESSIGKVYQNTPTETFIMNTDGTFESSFIGLLGGEYLFSLYAYDVDGRSSSIVSFDVDLISKYTLEGKDILFSPTLGFNNANVKQGKDIPIVGYATPGNTVELEIDSEVVDDTSPDTTGYYEFLVRTDSLKLGNHHARVRQIDNTSDFAERKVSNFSSAQSFRVSLLGYTRSDFNEDDTVDIADWSIFLFRWGSDDITLRSTTDLNDDGETNIKDFSIFLESVKISTTFKSHF